MLFSQDWIDRRATRSNLAKLQTFPLEKPRGSNSGRRYPLVFWMTTTYYICKPGVKGDILVLSICHSNAFSDKMNCSDKSDHNASYLTDFKINNQ